MDIHMKETEKVYQAWIKKRQMESNHESNHIENISISS